MGKMFLWVVLAFAVPCIVSLFIKNGKGAVVRGWSYVVVSLVLILVLKGMYTSGGRWSGPAIEEADSISENENSLDIHLVNADYSDLLMYGQEVPVSSISATSSISSRHTPEQMIDGDLTTSWQEGSAGWGIGDSIVVYPESNSIDYLVIFNGNQKSEYAYLENGRVKTVTINIETTDGICGGATVKCPDSMDAIAIRIDNAGEISCIELCIDEVYNEGTKYEDTCISEIQLFD